MTDKLFGSSPKTTVGAPQLPEHVQKLYNTATKYGQKFLDDPSAYFAPIGLTSEELMAEGLLNAPFTDPMGYKQNIETLLSPYRDIITSDINRQFEAPQGALASRASEAGAFGSSRHRAGEADLERTRLDAISNAMQGQYNIAQDQYNAGIGNLMNFGGLERSVDLQQRMAPVSAYQTYMSGTAPFIGAQTYNPVTTTGGSSGLLGGLQKAAGIAQTGMQLYSMFSDKRLKKNIKEIGRCMGLPLYIFEYIGDCKKVVGFMADEVEKLFPQAVFEKNGYKAVMYGVMG